MHPFISGLEYKRDQLMGFLGSRQFQSGVLWGPFESGCLICTSGGRHGRKAGYSDEELPDGRWWYFGQGTAGNQSLSNSANSKLAARDRSVLLFSSREPNKKEITQSKSYGKCTPSEPMRQIWGFS
jgi:5-methylcytosine-specific restriction protein A